MRTTRFCAPSRIRSRASEMLSYGSTQWTMPAHLERGTKMGSSSTTSDNSRTPMVEGACSKVEGATLVLGDSAMVSATKSGAVGGVVFLALCDS
ncbi:hypothetical protein BHE74_00033059 [Ensete ventricosum]|nr:hypothetical protein BHE74_00033059 [Ensete ventricosum]